VAVVAMSGIRMVVVFMAAAIGMGFHGSSPRFGEAPGA
jgi:hypothetical protein